MMRVFGTTLIILGLLLIVMGLISLPVLLVGAVVFIGGIVVIVAGTRAASQERLIRALMARAPDTAPPPLSTDDGARRDSRGRTLTLLVGSVFAIILGLAVAGLFMSSSADLAFAAARDNNGVRLALVRGGPAYGCNISIDQIWYRRTIVLQTFHTIAIPYGDFIDSNGRRFDPTTVRRPTRITVACRDPYMREMTVATAS